MPSIRFKPFVLCGLAAGLASVSSPAWAGGTIRHYDIDVGVKSFRFDRSEPSTNRYAPKAAPPDPCLTNVLTPEWVELASYAAWYPQQPGSGGYTYRLGVRADPGYAVAGPGVLAAAKDGWTLTQDDPSWDIVLVAGRGLRAQHVADGGLDMDVWLRSSRARCGRPSSTSPPSRS